MQSYNISEDLQPSVCAVPCSSDYLIDTSPESPAFCGGPSFPRFPRSIWVSNKGYFPGPLSSWKAYSNNGTAS